MPLLSDLTGGRFGDTRIDRSPEQFADFVFHSMVWELTKLGVRSRTSAIAGMLAHLIRRRYRRLVGFLVWRRRDPGPWCQWLERDPDHSSGTTRTTARTS